MSHLIIATAIKALLSQLMQSKTYLPRLATVVHQLLHPRCSQISSGILKVSMMGSISLMFLIAHQIKLIINLVLINPYQMLSETSIKLLSDQLVLHQM